MLLTSIDCGDSYQVRRPRIPADKSRVGRRTPRRGDNLVYTRRDGCAWCYTPSWRSVSPCRRGCSVGSSRPSATAQQSAAPGTESTRWPSLTCSGVPLLCLGDTDCTAGAPRSWGHGDGTWGFRGKPRRRTRQRTGRGERERRMKRRHNNIYKTTANVLTQGLVKKFLQAKGSLKVLWIVVKFYLKCKPITSGW